MKRAARRLVPMIVVSTLAAGAAFTAARAASPALASLEGQLIVAHGDDFARHTLTMQTSLRTPSGVVRLRTSRASHARIMALAGQHVRVSGTDSAHGFDVTSVSARGAATRAVPTIGSLRVAVVLMHLPGSRKQPVKEKVLEDTMFGPHSVSDWYAQGSGGQLTLTGHVFGWYDSHLPKNDCDVQQWLDAASTAAQSDGYSEQDYDDIVVYTPQQKSCIFGGLAFVGLRGVVLNGMASREVIEHEIGHNLGLQHAGTYSCAGAPFSTGCELVDYGDSYDVMGVVGRNHHFSAAHKYQLGWIPPSEVQTVTGGVETIDLTASEHPVIAGATELIEIPLANGSSYAIERRESFGYDANLVGVWVRLLEHKGTDDTELIDMTPETPDPFADDGNLEPGRPFVDATNDVTIETIADTGATASVQVCVGGCSTGPTTTLPHTGVVSVSVVGKAVVVTGTTGADVVHLDKATNGRLHVDASGAALTAGAGCTAQFPGVFCKATSFAASLGAGNDVVVVTGRVRTTLDGGPDNDVFYAGVGPDKIIGGSGFDTVDYRQRLPGTITAKIGGGAVSGAHGEHDDIGADVERALLP